jgi:hypothetical protein
MRISGAAFGFAQGELCRLSRGRLALGAAGTDDRWTAPPEVGATPRSKICFRPRIIV